MLSFYYFPDENWQQFRTTNPIGSVFAIAILRMTRSDNCNRLYKAFSCLAVNKGELDLVITLAESVLQQSDGWLFDGYKLDAAESWRRVSISN